MQRLREAAEKAKCELSSAAQVRRLAKLFIMT
jgi:molecular chaperone DnaK (HSP70)